MFVSLFILALSLSFILGQFARVQFGNGISVTLLDCTMVAFSVASLFRFFFSDNLKKIVSLSLFRPSVFFVVACVFSLLFNAARLSVYELGVSALYLLRFIAYSGALFFVPFFSRQQKTVLVRALVSSVFITIVLGYLQFLYYPNLRNLYYLEWDDHLYRLFSVFLDPNFASVIFASSAIFLLHSVLNSFRKEWKKGCFLGILASLSVLAIFLTYSRTGMITLAAGTVALLLMRGYKKFLLACLMLFALLLFLTADFTVEGLNPLRTVSTNARVESARIAIEVFRHSPIVGVGFNAYRYAQHRYGFRPDDRWKTSHADAGTDNSFLFVLATTGIIGLGCYLFFWYSMIRASYIASRKGRGTLATVAFATVVALLASSFFLNTLFYPFILIWILCLYAVTENTSP